MTLGKGCDASLGDTRRGGRHAPEGGLFGFLINEDGLPAALREREAATSVNGVPPSVHSRPTRNSRSVWFGVRLRFARTLWRMLHGVAEGWPCGRCRPRMSVWMQGLHDAVSVRLGKRPFRPDSFARYESGSLEGPYHRACFGCRLARIGSRWVARAPRPQLVPR